jgi:HEAT repeat protein
MALMRKRDPALQETGFQELLPVAGQHLPALTEAFRTETDHGLRCWLLELIGEARSPDAFELLAEQLDSDDESIRNWAIRGLEQLNTKDARRLLWERRVGPSAR